jgi:Rad3-related DNA helicase
MLQILTTAGTLQFQNSIGFWCIHASAIFGTLQPARCVILSSGTLSPMHTFPAELGTDFPIVVQAPHVIQSGQVRF